MRRKASFKIKKKTDRRTENKKTDIVKRKMDISIEKEDKTDTSSEEEEEQMHCHIYR